jgi:energy-coupling factor transporter ATP-binding protein EcfA2
MALLAADRPEAARSALTRALGLWRGAAFEEFAFEDFARPEAVRLEELRLAAQEASLQAELELGLHATAVVELERLTAAQPLRERLWALLMLALYRSGRQADALRAYAHARRLLAGELGLEPGAELRQLEDRILAHDPSLDWRPQAPVSIATPVAPSQRDGPPSSPAAATARAETAAPRRSPAGTPLVGREAELATLHHALDGLDEARGSALVIIGEPGIGKTTLLVELAGRAEERGHLVCRGRADEFERDVPFAIFIDALDTVLVSLWGGEGALSDERAAELGAVFPSLATSVMQVPALPQERYRLHRAVGRALEHLAARRPVVLVLDDLHWADAASVELTSHLLRHPPQAEVLLCLAARPGQASSRLVSAFTVAARAGLAERIDLGPLSPADVQQLVGSGIDEATREELWRESGGNPFYLNQLLRVARSGRGRDWRRTDRSRRRCHLHRRRGERALRNCPHRGQCRRRAGRRL